MRDWAILLVLFVPLAWLLIFSHAHGCELEPVDHTKAAAETVCAVRVVCLMDAGARP